MEDLFRIVAGFSLQEKYQLKNVDTFLSWTKTYLIMQI